MSAGGYDDASNVLNRLSCWSDRSNEPREIGRFRHPAEGLRRVCRPGRALHCRGRGPRWLWCPIAASRCMGLRGYSLAGGRWVIGLLPEGGPSDAEATSNCVENAAGSST